MSKALEGADCLENKKSTATGKGQGGKKYPVPDISAKSILCPYISILYYI